MRLNEEIQKNLTNISPQPQQVAYQQTDANNSNKRQRLNAVQVQDLKKFEQSPNQGQPVTYSNVSQPVQPDRRQYVVARPQGYYLQQQEYVQHTQELHYGQHYNQQNGYSQQYS